MSFLGKAREWLGFEDNDPSPATLKAVPRPESIDFNPTHLSPELAQRIQNDGSLTGLMRGIRVTLCTAPLPTELHAHAQTLGIDPGGRFIGAQGIFGPHTRYYCAETGRLIHPEFNPNDHLERSPAAWMTAAHG